MNFRRELISNRMRTGEVLKRTIGQNQSLEEKHLQSNDGLKTAAIFNPQYEADAAHVALSWLLRNPQSINPEVPGWYPILWPRR